MKQSDITVIIVKYRGIITYYSLFPSMELTC
jgi:hypothetical protein